jgi:transposase InsO family protein
MAKENERWGYTRIMGALKNLGHEIGRNTISCWKMVSTPHLNEGGECHGRNSSRHTWVRSSAWIYSPSRLATWLGLVRYHVLFAIDIASRKVEIFGMVTNPGGTWMEQMARNLVDAVDGFLVGKRYLLIDRDTLYTNAFRRILGQGGVKAVRLPARSPNLNAFAERFVLSIKSECLDRLVPLGEAHLRRAILEYTNHYHEERNHQGLDNDLISPAKTTNGVGKVSRRGRLGGLLSFYYREAA